MKIKTQLFISFGCIFFLLCAAIGVSILGSKRAEYLQKKSGLILKELSAITDVRATIKNRLLLSGEFLLLEKIHRDSEMERRKEAIRAAWKAVDLTYRNEAEVMETYGDLYNLEFMEDMKKIADLQKIYQEIDASVENAISGAKANRFAEAKSTYLAAMKIYEDRFMPGVSEVVRQETEESNSLLTQLEKNISWQRREYFVILLVVVLGILAFVYSVSEALGKKLTLMEEAMERVSQGDLETLIPTDESKNELSRLAVGMNGMIIGLRLVNTLKSLRDAAEHANQAKSSFLANISHELRTPMHGILSFARFGKQKIDTATKEKLHSYFDEIYESGSRLMVLLNDLLDLSKLEAGKIIYAKKENNLAEIVNAVISEMSAFSKEKGLRIELEMKEAEVVGVFDGERMMQVVRNLVSNAVKFSEKGNTVFVRLEKDSERIRCFVVNRGIGIPAYELKMVFDKFVQSTKTRTGAGGTGLGLAICKEIIEGHQGNIWAESEIGQETRFIFEIPVSPGADRVEAA